MARSVKTIISSLDRQYAKLTALKAELMQRNAAIDLFATQEYVKFAELYMRCLDDSATETTAQDAHQAMVELVRYADSHTMQFDIPSNDFILAVKRYASMLDPVAKTKIDNTVRTRYVSRTD